MEQAFPAIHDNEFRNRLKDRKDSAFDFVLDWARNDEGEVKTSEAMTGMVLRPKGEFDPGKHGDDLISYAQEMLDSATSTWFAALFAFPVVHFLLSGFPRLGDQQKVRVCALFARMGDLQEGEGAAAPGTHGAMAMAKRLQPLIAISLLNATLDRLKQAGDSPERLNAACWLLEKRSQLFGGLADTTVQAMLEEAIPGFKLLQGVVAVDEQKALEFLQSAIEPTVESLARFFQHSGVARSAGIEDPLLTCWMTLASTNDIGCLTALVLGIGSTTVTSEEHWKTVMGLHEEARKALGEAVSGGKADIAHLLGLHKALIDSIVSVCQGNAKGSLAARIIAWGQDQLKAMSENLAVLKLLSQGHANAAVWPLLAGVQLKINQHFALAQAEGAPALPHAAAPEIDNTLKQCASPPTVILDGTLHDVIASAIDFHVGRSEFDQAFSLLRLLYNSLIYRKEKGLVPKLKADCLEKLMEKFGSEPSKVEDLPSTMVALASALIANDSDKALERLEAACSKLPREERQFACLGFLHLAIAFMDRGEGRHISKAFRLAIEALPGAAIEGPMLLRRFKGSDDIGYLIAQLQGIGGATLRNEDQWLAAKRIYADARRKLSPEIKAGQAPDIVSLRRLYKALVDSIVSLCKGRHSSPAAEQIITGGLELLEEIRKDPVLTALLSKDEILVSAIESHVSRGEFGEAFSLLRLLYDSSIAGEEQGTELQQINASCLQQLLKALVSTPQVAEPEAAMIALVGALRAHSPAFAMQALKNVCIHGLPGVLPLACIGFLHLAKVFIAQSDEESMHQAFDWALLILSNLDRGQRDRLGPYFDDFFHALTPTSPNRSVYGMQNEYFHLA